METKKENVKVKQKDHAKMKEKMWLIAQANSKDVNVNRASDSVWKHKKGTG